VPDILEAIRQNPRAGARHRKPYDSLLCTGILPGINGLFTIQLAFFLITPQDFFVVSFGFFPVFFGREPVVNVAGERGVGRTPTVFSG
jgi:hypothetical protein